MSHKTKINFWSTIKITIIFLNQKSTECEEKKQEKANKALNNQPFTISETGDK